jgi:AcrR family transcriptional regulator
MRQDIRLEILHTAKVMFNERGYNAVSINDISKALGISKGNLTYHFKKKEEIIEAIIEDLSAAYRPFEPPANLEEMNALIVHIQEMVQENAFYFWHHAQLSQLSPRIREQQNRVYQINRNLFMLSFVKLHSDGLLLCDQYPKQHEHTVDAILLACVYWLPFSTIKGEHSQPVHLQAHIWSIITPLLTNHGKQMLQNLIT